MSQDETAELDSTLNETTEETTEQMSQESFEPVSHDDDDGLSDAQRQFKEKRREENRLAREALKEVPNLKTKIEKLEFFKKSPQAEKYEQDIDAFRASNPTVSLTDAFRYVLADKNPAELLALSDEGMINQVTQSRTAPNSGEKSFSEQVGEQPVMNDAQLRNEAIKEMARLMG